MAARTVKDAKDLDTNELIYFKSHAKATYMSNGTTVEDAIANINHNQSSIPVITENTVLDWGFTKNSGTITGVSANGTLISTIGTVDIPAASTTKYGVTKLSSSTNSTSTSLAATSSAVKSAYDLANNKQDKLVSGTNIKTINGNDITGSGNININDSGNYRLAEHGTSDTVYTLSSNTFHVWSVVPSLTITFGNESSGIANEYIFQFISGAEPTVLTLPDNIVWANDEIPEIESNYVYQISILNGYATLLKFKYNS